VYSKLREKLASLPVVQQLFLCVWQAVCSSLRSCPESFSLFLQFFLFLYFFGCAFVMTACSSWESTGKAWQLPHILWLRHCTTMCCLPAAEWLIKCPKLQVRAVFQVFPDGGEGCNFTRTFLWY